MAEIIALDDKPVGGIRIVVREIDGAPIVDGDELTAGERRHRMRAVAGEHRAGFVDGQRASSRAESPSLNVAKLSNVSSESSVISNRSQFV